ncbi:MFS transporter [Streptomyces sp. NPDC058440]|uniref:MFS transporter n=1 Tax=Streptomyces sp. NPDC058440 TaxID=3346501 RepID=UPI003647D4A9
MSAVGSSRPEAAARSGQQPRAPAALPALCVTQITSWGVLYYAFPVLNPKITAATGWPGGATTAAFSAALLLSAVAGICVGAVIDRRGPRGVMTAGSALGVLSVLLVATAPNIAVFAAGWLLAGLAMAATFYQPAFAALTRWRAPDHVRALTVLTLAGGLSSTVFAPLTAALAEHLSWRASYAVLAAVLAVVTIPAHALALRAPWPPAPAAPAQQQDGEAAGVVPIMRSRSFRVLAAALGLAIFVAFAVVVAQVPLLLERGYTSAQAAWALGLGGVGQAAGRLLYGPLARRTTPTARTVALFTLGGVTTAALALAPGPYGLLVALSVAAGMVRGNLTLLQATAVADRWGTAHYGRLSAALALPATTAQGLAPFAATALASALGGYPLVFGLLALLAALSALFALGSRPQPAR